MELKVNIKVNGKDIDFEQSTVFELVKKYKLDPQSIAVEKNGKIVHRDDYSNESIISGDIIEIVKFVGGG